MDDRQTFETQIKQHYLDLSQDEEYMLLNHIEYIQNRDEVDEDAF